MSILYPVAGSADEALQAPRGVAAREREARDVASGPVIFFTEAVGPAFVTRDALAEAFQAAVAQPWCAMRPVSKEAKAKGPVKPVNADGRRWADPASPEPALWRLSISYWRIESAEAPPPDHARKLRRDPDARELDA